MSDNLRPYLVSWWGKQCVLNTPSNRKSMFYRAVAYSNFFNPGRKALSFATTSKKEVPRRIPVLLLRCSPSAIIGRVIPVALNSVNTVFWRRWIAHILQEILKAIEPPFAYFDAPPSVNMPVDSSRVGASALYALPANINPCASHPMFLWRVGSDSVPGDLFAQASTRLSSPIRKAATAHNGLFATGANTSPHCAAVAFSYASLVSHSGQSSKSLPRQILDALGQYNIFSHCLLILGGWLGPWLCFQHAHGLSFNYTRGAAWSK